MTKFFKEVTWPVSIVTAICIFLYIFPTMSALAWSGLGNIITLIIGVSGLILILTWLMDKKNKELGEYAFTPLAFAIFYTFIWIIKYSFNQHISFVIFTITAIVFAILFQPINPQEYGESKVISALATFRNEALRYYNISKDAFTNYINKKISIH